MAEFVTFNHFNQEVSEILNYMLDFRKEMELHILDALNLRFEWLLKGCTFEGCLSLQELREKMGALNYTLVRL